MTHTHASDPRRVTVCLGIEGTLNIPAKPRGSLYFLYMLAAIVGGNGGGRRSIARQSRLSRAHPAV